MVKRDRQDYGEMIRLFTGHNYLNRHSHLLGEAESAECRLCGEEEETSEHVLCECPALNETRFRALGAHQTSADAFSLLPLDSVRGYISLLRRALCGGGLEKI